MQSDDAEEGIRTPLKLKVQNETNYKCLLYFLLPNEPHDIVMVSQ